MKDNTEIRQESWQLLIKGQWVWRLLGASILLSMAARFIYSLVNAVMLSLNCVMIFASFYIGVGQTILYKELDEASRNSTVK